MKKSPVVLLLQSLNKKELRDLSKWLQSPFFNQRQDVIQLFEYLKEHLIEGEQALKKERVFQHLFQKEVYDDAKIRHSMSFLHQQIKKYLAYDHWQNQPFQQDLALISALRQHNQEIAFQKNSQQLSLQFEQTQSFTHLRHFYQYQNHLEQYRASLKQSRTDEMNLQEVSDALTIFYFCETLRIACLMFAHQTVNVKMVYQTQMLTEVLEKSKIRPYKDIPEVAIYVNTYLALTQSEIPQYFQKLKKLITQNWQRFAIDEMRDIYLLAINYCIKKLNNGQTEFIQEALDLYKVGLEKEILFENGELSRFTYNNVLTLGLMSHQFEWSRDFLETYQTYLPTKKRKNIYLYNLTVYHFKKQEYPRVMDLLHQVQFRDVLYNLNARRMLLRSYFEMEEIDALESLLDSFQVFIRRRKDLGYHKENFKNLIKFVKKLLLIGHNKKAREELLKKIERTAAVTDKDWLLEKVKASG